MGQSLQLLFAPRSFDDINMASNELPKFSSYWIARFALLIPLALTSANGWQKQLGRRWKVLHRLVYFAIPLSILPYLWLERNIRDWFSCILDA